MPRGRIPTVASLERRALAAKTRQTKLIARQKLGPKAGVKGDIPRIPVNYKSIMTDDEYGISASKTAVDFFGMDKLGVTAAAANTGPPRGFRPNLVFATKANLSGKVFKSALTGNEYLRYTDAFAKGNPRNFSAPMQAATIAEIKTKLTAIYGAIKGTIGNHGVLRFTFEKSPLTFG